MSGSALLISTYELGHQPFGLASPAAWLRSQGIKTHLCDLARDTLDEAAVRSAALVAFYLPMHTATRLAAPVIKNVRAINPASRICAYGLYAPLNAEWLRSIGVDEVLGGEFEAELAAMAREACGLSERRMHEMVGPTPRALSGHLPRLRFLVPDRNGLPPLSRYSTLRVADGTRRAVGYTEASRGCRHLCRHCPVVPVYQGQFRVVQTEVVFEDIDQQVAEGAEHITLGDPDFFNGPTHAMRIVEGLHARHPAVTYDVTIKVEHLLRHRTLLPRLRETGCLFVTSAVESLDDRVLALLEKGHTRADFLEAVKLCRTVPVALVPTFVPFHPWTTLAGYCDLLETLAALDLVERVAPIQLAIRLLIPAGSRLLDVDAWKPHLGAFDPVTLTYRWTHPDPRVDALQRDVSAIVGRRLTSDRREVFEAIDAAARACAGVSRRVTPHPRREGAVPYLDEPWYCCAEPNPEQLMLV